VDADEVAGLVGAAASGDSRAWQLLVERFSGLVWAVTRGYCPNPADAADVFQTTWLRLVEHLDRLAHPEHVGAWLATTARRESLRVARAGRRTFATDDDALAGLGYVEHHSPERAVLEAEQARLDAQRAQQVWGAFRGLPSRCQQLLRVLMTTPPPSYAQVAAALGMPIGSIGPSRARCLDQLRQRLAPDVSAPL
jgi:RNA polymerase sigma factor (sigma-70 family)